MNKLDKDYQALLQDILDNGHHKNDRTGTGTISVFGRQIRHKMSEGLPLLTTKRIPFKLVVTELLWFLRGDTNIKFLVDNDCHIWDGDVYKNYEQSVKKSIDQATREGILRDSNDYNLLSKETFINRIKTDDEFAKKFGELGPIYGKQWRDWGSEEILVDKYFGDDEGFGYIRKVKEYSHGIDQIANLIRDLKTNPDSRRLIVSAWNVESISDMVLPPCHYGFQVYTRELSLQERRLLVTQGMFNQIYNGDGPESLSHKEIDQWNVPTRSISLIFNMRSSDVPLGLPFNIASYGLLLEIIAKTVNMVPDELIGNLGDCHIYTNQIDGVKEQIGREPFELPTLNINTEWWPTELGECGVGHINAMAIIRGFSDDSFCRCLLEEDIQLCNYQSHPTIKIPLSN